MPDREHCPRCGSSRIFHALDGGTCLNCGAKLRRERAADPEEASY